MAPLLGPSMTPSPSFRKATPNRPIVPIVPAIPRSLERKSKEQSPTPVIAPEIPPVNGFPVRSKKDERPTQEVSVLPAQNSQSATQPETVAGANAEVGDLQNREPLASEDERGHEESEGKSVFQSLVQMLTIPVAVETKVLSPSTTQDFGIERHGFKLPPPFYPRKSPPTAISTDLPHTDQPINVLQETPDSIDETALQREIPTKRMSLRGSAPSFHAHPTPPSDIMTSPTASSAKGFPVARSISFHPQPTPPADTSPSPTHSYQGSNHAQSQAFSPPPPTSSHNASSPAHSIYHGYVYGPSPYEYSPEIPATRQPSGSARPETESQVPVKQHDTVGSPYYSQPPAFPLLGSQPPLTPSATPFSNMPQQSNYMNGYLPPESMIYNYASPVPEHQPQNGYPGHNTLNSHGLSSSNGEQAYDGLSISQTNIYQSHVWPTATLNSSQVSPVNAPCNQAPLVAHLLRNFNLPVYADCRLILTHKEERFGLTQWYLSSLLLAQSTKLRDLLQASRTGTDGRKLIQLTLTDRFVTPRSMEAVIRVCYGESPYAFSGTNPQDQFSRTRTEALTPWMTDTLSYAAAGFLLKMDSVVLRGLDIASKILSWENLEKALSFGLESEIERGRSASASVIPAYRSLNPVDGEHSSSCAYNSLPSQETPTTDNSNVPTSSTSASGDYRSPQPQSAFDLLMHCLRFLTDSFPVSWRLDVSARPLADVDRLPVTAESQSPLSKSRLCTIQFGDRPSEATAKSTDRNLLVSTILLSLPHIWLDYMLKSVGEPIRHEITSIVKERERRRYVVLRNQSISWEQRVSAKDYEWAEAGYEESVQTSNDGEVTLSRRYTGIARDTVDDGTATKV